MSELIEKLKVQIIEHLNIEEVEPSELINDESLFKGVLALDSIDILELIVLIEKEYNLKIANAEIGQKVFVDINTIVDFITNPEKYQS